jgi:hypothetical protein
MPSGATGGPVFNELNSALLTAANSMERFETVLYTANFIYGIGQRAFQPAHAEEIFQQMQTGKTETVNFVNLRD